MNRSPRAVEGLRTSATSGSVRIRPHRACGPPRRPPRTRRVATKRRGPGGVSLGYYMRRIVIRSLPRGRPGARARRSSPNCHARRTMEQLPTDYPATLEIDYPDAPRNWFTTLLRPLLVAPIAIILALVSGPGVQTRAAVVHRSPAGVMLLLSRPP